MKHLSVLIKPASSLCDMRCKYCFYHDISSLREAKSFGFMKGGVMEKLIDQVYLDLDHGDHMSFAFQGGEPTLIGLNFFKQFVAYINKQIKQVHVSYTIQTNGLKIDDNWCLFFKENQFLVGLSIDIDPSLHDENRYDVNGQGTYKRVMKTKALFDEYQVEYNVLSVLTNQLARHPQKVFNFLLAQKIRYIQFIPCLEELDTEEPSPFALTPSRFASFYTALFKLWLKEFSQGNYISIKLFDDLIHLLATGKPTACGMLGNCKSQYVIEADGSTYPCDFYVLDEYQIGNITAQTVFEMARSTNLNKFLCTNGESKPEYCQKCPFYRMCFGGCKRMRNAIYFNEKESQCGYQSFLTQNIEKLTELAQKERLYRM